MLKFDKAVIGDCLWEQMPQVLTYMLQVKMLQAAIARTMEQNHDNHYLRLRQCRIPVIFALILGLYRVFFHLRIKNFAEIICHTKKSVILSSVIIAIFVCISLYFNTIKLQQISLITKFISTYNSSNSRYNSNDGESYIIECVTRNRQRQQGWKRFSSVSTDPCTSMR